jgi:hypothetical protein
MTNIENTLSTMLNFSGVAMLAIASYISYIHLMGI